MARTQHASDDHRRDEDEPAAVSSFQASSPLGGPVGFADVVADNVVACATSAAILSRGLQFMNQARLRAYLMCVDDGLRIVKAMGIAKNGREWIGLERQLYMRAASWSISRTLMLTVMAVQLGEDAVVPLARRLDAALDMVA